MGVWGDLKVRGNFVAGGSESAEVVKRHLERSQAFIACACGKRVMKSSGHTKCSACRDQERRVYPKRRIRGKYGE